MGEIDVSHAIFACSNGNLETVKTFVESGGDINGADSDGNSLLHWAAYKNHMNVTQYLVEKKATIDLLNNIQQTPLLWACVSGHANVVHYLVQQGANLRVADNSGYTALHHVTQNGHPILCYYLLFNGFPVDIPDNDGHTPLHWAVYQGFDDIIHMLFNYRADPNKVDKQGYSGLHWAVFNTKPEAAYTLLSEGADMFIKDKDGMTPLELAKSKDNKPMIKLLKKAAEIPLYFHNKDRYNKMWFYVPQLMVPFIFLLLTSSLYLIVSIALISGVGWGLNFTIGKYWPGNDTKNPFLSSWFIASYWVSAYVYLSRVIYSCEVIETIFFLAINAVLLYCFFTVMTGDPGYLERSTLSSDVIIDCLENNRGTPPICTTCMLIKPVRSKHCRHCRRCVAKLDHHCTWLNNCVAAANHPTFFILITTFVLVHAIFAKFCYNYLAMDTNAPTFFPLKDSIFYHFNNEPWVFCMLIYHILNFAWETPVFLTQVRAVVKNITSNEMINQHRYAYLNNSNGQFFNPFDRGIKNNIIEFFFERNKWYRPGQ